MLWFSFIPGLNVVFLCVKLIIIHYHTQTQRKIKFKPRMKLNHNVYIWWCLQWHHQYKRQICGHCFYCFCDHFNDKKMLWDNKLQWQKYFKEIIESIWTSCFKIRGKIKMTILCKQRFMHVCQKNALAPLFNIKTLLFSWNLPLNLCYTESDPQLAWCFACHET